MKPWTGDGCDNPWTVTASRGDHLEQKAQANYGSGNTNGVEFRVGTTNLADTMIATTDGIDAEGVSGYVEFWVKTVGLTNDNGWAFQLDAGTGYVTRISELTGANHNWRLYHYDLLPGEITDNLRMRFQFRAGANGRRMRLDEIRVNVLPEGGWTPVDMLPAGTDVYGAGIPVMPAGTTVDYYVTAADDDGYTAANPARAPGEIYRYLVHGHAPHELTHPNLVVIVSDDHGWNDVSYQGSVVDTPNIDSLVADGIELDRFYVFPVCSPTRAAFLTGRSPIRLGITNPINEDQDGLSLSEHLLPETLTAHGYQTWMCGKWHLGGGTGEAYLPHHRGFDHFYGFVSGAVDSYTHVNSRTGEVDWQRNGATVIEEGYSAYLLADECVGLIQDRDPTRPFFLYLPFHAVHTPLRAPQALVDKYETLGLTNQSRRVLAAMVEAMDEAIGTVLTALDVAGLRDNTVVLFFSDNGGDEEGGGASNGPLRGQKGDVFEGGIRVPAAIRWPGVLDPGCRSRQVVSAWDLFPTLAAALGVRPQNAKPFDGRNLWGAIRSCTAIPPEGLVFVREDTAVLDGAWKLVRVKATGENLLFRIDQDPYEQQDLSAQHPDVVAELLAKMEAVTSPELRITHWIHDPGTGAATFTWNSNPGKMYDLESATSLTVGDWTAMKSLIPAGNPMRETITVVNDDPAVRRRYYRIRER